MSEAAESGTKRRWWDSWWGMGLVFLVVFAAVRLLFEGTGSWLSVLFGAGVYAVVMTAVYRRRHKVLPPSDAARPVR